MGQALHHGADGDLLSESGSEIYHVYDAQLCTNALLDHSGNLTAPWGRLKVIFRQGRCSILTRRAASTRG